MVHRPGSALIQSEASPESRQMTWTLGFFFHIFLNEQMDYCIRREVEGQVPVGYSLFYQS